MPSTTTTQKLPQKYFYHTLTLLCFLLVCRILAICAVPINDYSESRYSEIARKMIETGNWVTPLHDYGVPFWAKPPLSTWLSAFSMKVFGINEFAARLPGLILSIGILCLVWSIARKQSGNVVAWVTTLVLASTLNFFLDAGAVMTDPSLIFCTTLCMVAFWRALVYSEKLWSYLFFVGLGLGLLAKGPVAVVLTGLPIFFWVLWRNQWINLWQRLPWIKGTLLTLAIALPWYILAEIRTPGFLNYFIIGEHFHRFLDSGWGGDKYGHAHSEPWGMIWLFVLIGLCPWTVPTITWLVRYRKQAVSLLRDEHGWMSYLLCFTIAPLLFFTFSSNIIYTYTFPVLAPFALWFTEAWSRANKSLTDLKWILPLAVFTGAGFLAAIIVFQVKPEMVAKTQKPIIHNWLQQHPDPKSLLIYWEFGVPYSAQFYSAGKASWSRDVQNLCSRISNKLDNYLVIDPNDYHELPAELLAQFTPIYKVVYKDKTRVLMHCPVLTC